MTTYTASWSNGPLGAGFFMLLPQLVPTVTPVTRRSGSAGGVGFNQTREKPRKRTAHRPDRRREDATAVAMLLLLEAQQ